MITATNGEGEGTASVPVAVEPDVPMPPLEGAGTKDDPFTGDITMPIDTETLTPDDIDTGDDTGDVTIYYTPDYTVLRASVALSLFFTPKYFGCRHSSLANDGELIFESLNVESLNLFMETLAVVTVPLQMMAN